MYKLKYIFSIYVIHFIPLFFKCANTFGSSQSIEITIKTMKWKICETNHSKLESSNTCGTRKGSHRNTVWEAMWVRITGFVIRFHLKKKKPSRLRQISSQSRRVKKPFIKYYNISLFFIIIILQKELLR